MTAQPTGPLLGRFVQLGYVTRDIDAAIGQYSERFGPAEFMIVPSTPENPELKRIALTWVGAVMIELIEVDPAVPSIYIETLAGTGPDIRLHHTGHLVDDCMAQAERVKAAGFDVPVIGQFGDISHWCYADMRAQLGHYIEYIWLGEKGKEWFSSVPGFTALPA